MGHKSPLLKLSLLSLAVSFAVNAEEATTAVADDLEVIVVSGTKTAKPLKDELLQAECKRAHAVLLAEVGISCVNGRSFKGYTSGLFNG